MGIKKLQVDVHGPTATAMHEALKDLRALQAKHDARIWGLALLDRAATMYAHLIKLGLETPESADAMFRRAAERAKTDVRKTTVMGQETSAVPS